MNRRIISTKSFFSFVFFNFWTKQRKKQENTQSHSSTQSLLDRWWVVFFLFLFFFASLLSCVLYFVYVENHPFCFFNWVSTCCFLLAPFFHPSWKSSLFFPLYPSLSLPFVSTFFLSSLIFLLSHTTKAEGGRSMRLSPSISKISNYVTTRLVSSLATTTLATATTRRSFVRVDQRSYSSRSSLLPRTSSTSALSTRIHSNLLFSRSISTGDSMVEDKNTHAPSIFFLLSLSLFFSIVHSSCLLFFRLLLTNFWSTLGTYSKQAQAKRSRGSSEEKILLRSSVLHLWWYRRSLWLRSSRLCGEGQLARFLA